MGIVTKKGDKGRTSLYRGARVYKDDIVIEACGCLDELISYLGVSKSMLKDKKNRGILEIIQKDLFLIGAEISTGRKLFNKIEKRIDELKVNKLDEEIKMLEASIMLANKGFCLPGKDSVSSFLHVARTIARKFERRIVSFKRKKLLSNQNILIYLNRLSDYLFLLARYIEMK